MFVMRKKQSEKNEESDGDLYITCSIFLNYMKRKCTMEMKSNVKFPKNSCKI